MMKHPVVAVALSGGVDSLVTGFLLKQRFKQVFGIHFTTGYEHGQTDLSVLETRLGFKVHMVDLSESFEQEVVQYLVRTYLNGKTPNPCLICNQKIKFGKLLDHSLALGADYLATGHYGTVANRLSSPGKSIETPYIEKGADPLKDQSYFLSRVGSSRLDRVIFPLAGMIKTDVKAIARSNGLSPVQSGESQDICFIRDNAVSRFIIEKTGIKPEAGPIVDTDGNVLGTHTGLHQFTVGQRRGINCPASAPYYVKTIDINNNRLVVCFKEHLSANKMIVDDMVWHTDPGLISKEKVTTKIRYSHKGAVSAVTPDGQKAVVIFDSPQHAVTPGQGAVFYQENRVLGSGIIQ